MKKLLVTLLCATIAYPAVEEFCTKRNVSAVESFEERIKSGNVIVDFFAPWCGPCKSISPIFADLSNKHKNVSFIKVNIDNFPDIKTKYRVRGIPQLLFFKDGKLIKTLVGAQNKKALDENIRSVFK